MGRTSLKGSLNSDYHEIFITKDNVKSLAKTLEPSFGLLWDNKKTAAANAIQLLRSYSESWSFTRHHRKEIRALTSLLIGHEDEKEFSEDFKIAALECFSKISREGKSDGAAAQTLKYLLIHCSGEYTLPVRVQVIMEYLDTLSCELESYSSSSLSP